MSADALNDRNGRAEAEAERRANELAYAADVALGSELVCAWVRLLEQEQRLLGTRGFGREALRDTLYFARETIAARLSNDEGIGLSFLTSIAESVRIVARVATGRA